MNYTNLFLLVSSFSVCLVINPKARNLVAFLFVFVIIPSAFFPDKPVRKAPLSEVKSSIKSTPRPWTPPPNATPYELPGITGQVEFKGERHFKI